MSRIAFHRTVAALLAASFGGAALGQEAEGSFVLWDSEALDIRGGVELGFQVVTQDSAFWNLGETFAPGSSYDASPTWGEAYVKPYLGFTYVIGGGTTAYGRLSAVSSYTMGTDVFEVEGANDTTIDDAVIGIRNPGEGGGLGFDFSLGAQPYKLGTGMLISDGGGDGFERGTVIFGPRQAWERTAISRLTWGESGFDLFYLDANELESSDTGTTLAGAAFTRSFGQVGSFGLGLGTVLESDAPWPKAAPGGNGLPEVIMGAREGLGFATAWGTWSPTPALTLAADVAVQENGDRDMRAYGGRVQASYALTEMRFQPRFTYTFQAFSGDDPDTDRIERFDPLFYDGSPSGWATGSNASMVFINSNVMAHQLSANLTLSPRDFLTARYYHVRALELGSPLQFGQATRLDEAGGAPTLVSGVTDAHLSDDFYLEYTRVLAPNAFLTGGAGVSIPGEGIRELRGGERDLWSGAFVNLVIRF